MIVNVNVGKISNLFQSLTTNLSAQYMGYRYGGQLLPRFFFDAQIHQRTHL